jgi:hypothetical protein
MTGQIAALLLDRKGGPAVPSSLRSARVLQPQATNLATFSLAAQLIQEAGQGWGSIVMGHQKEDKWAPSAILNKNEKGED